MKKLFTCVIFLGFGLILFGQSAYFPPITGNEWETTDPSDLNWCTDKIDPLYDFLEEKNTKAFIVLKDGKIVLEKYFNDHDQNKFWYWASAGKTLTCFLTGKAASEGLLDINAPTSDYLGEGWTSLDPDQEAKITVLNQLTMTSGLDDSGDPYCTDPECLTYKTDPGDRWAYHNAPYTLLDQVVASATGVTLNQYHNQKVKTQTGMKGLFIKSGFNNVYWSDARSMARFGWLVLNDGVWDGNTVLNHPTFIENMRKPSQDLNPSYGYLWWLNGRDGYMLPGLQLLLRGWISPSAPGDMYAGMGKDGQFVNIVPGENLIVVRMGNAPDNSAVPVLFHDEMWAYLGDVMCTATSTNNITGSYAEAFPNPCYDFVELPKDKGWGRVICRSTSGQKITLHRDGNRLDTSALPAGIYYAIYRDVHNELRTTKFVKGSN